MQSLPDFQKIIDELISRTETVETATQLDQIISELENLLRAYPKETRDIEKVIAEISHIRSQNNIILKAKKDHVYPHTKQRLLTCLSNISWKV